VADASIAEIVISETAHSLMVRRSEIIRPGEKPRHEARKSR
jgi:hypothetical protein